MRITNARSGFTLLEILIVVVIFGILATIAIMRIGSIQDDAEVTAIQDQLRALRLQIGYYHFIENTYPDSLPALSTAGYVSHTPVHPGAGSFVYNNSTGVLTSSVDTSW